MLRESYREENIHVSLEVVLNISIQNLFMLSIWLRLAFKIAPLISNLWRMPIVKSKTYLNFTLDYVLLDFLSFLFFSCMNLVKVVKIQSFMKTKERKPRWEVSFVAAGVYVPEQIKKCFKCKKKISIRVQYWGSNRVNINKWCSKEQVCEIKFLKVLAASKYNYRNYARILQIWFSKLFSYFWLYRANNWKTFINETAKSVLFRIQIIQHIKSSCWGSILFVSDLYSENISDNDLIKQCGFKDYLKHLKEWKFIANNDDLMADKRF